MPNILPIMALAGGAAFLIARGKRKQKERKEAKEEAEQEAAQQATDLAEDVAGAVKPPKEEIIPGGEAACVKRFSASTGLSVSVLQSGRPMIAAASCGNLEFSNALDKACEVNPGMDFMLLDEETAEEGAEELRGICEMLGGGGFINVITPAENGLRIFDWEDVADLRYEPSKVTPEAVVNSAVAYAAGKSDHPASRFMSDEEVRAWAGALGG